MARPAHDVDVCVIGGGHAGTEAAVAAARRGARTALLTTSLETIGQLSCNPAMGGIAKGTVIREIDALGGVMGRATDLATLQFRMLNRGKGPAVWAPRAQADRGLYRRAVRSLLERQPLLTTVQGTAERLLFGSNGRLTGVLTTDGREIRARAVVITTGTFLRGRIHIGTGTSVSGGRAGEAATVTLAEQFGELGLETGRFKTGTPPRIDGRSVDLGRLERQDSEIERFDFSWSAFWDTPRRASGRTRHPEQLPCFITYVEQPAKDVVQRRLEESAMYGGAIGTRGPRYCPSIEDKIVRFPDAERHQLYLEPEGHDTQEMYVNGLSTSLPVDAQLELLHAVPGLEQAVMTRPGYAIEYDYVPPTQLWPSLELRALPGVFLAGQINGTTGYEEAGGQGVVAGLNAAAAALDHAPVTLGRDTSYIGVLVDDLVSRGVDEPYRLFTSRSEFRLTVRQDNAIPRLYAIGDALGLYTDAERRLAERRLEDEREARVLAARTSLTPQAAEAVLVACGESTLTQAVPLIDVAKRQKVALRDLFAAAGVGVTLGPDAVTTADLEIKYAGYLERERTAAARLQRLASLALPADLAYDRLINVSVEARQKLAARRPATLAEAASVPGVSPADLQNLAFELGRW
ncbi:tRNA uridine-5-carboxymethylaminomethyl(34) synthesis enzyme MnmG [Pseudogemmatithrix spongiicola]|uniref:tRNA uridine 5-carboxymethylaminomethyl modification enzyme MnmG n=1 Tax=Pseudogemmatithrix spongiicola TaxID=3062599 RepID=A0AA49JRT1_9BACT|nr:tRNA uridine-5-carboxymethylaminomethyl(34) synthesis enzyme MnmG [Gemmatimonadaceae bacterium 'strain 138']WKW13702.1 tRNA uridine-5-carboxymethylaminomethyl(34) synthesis enzyme MnmG [Gemmatimonadaceae bacterium 'strain 318']